MSRFVPLERNALVFHTKGLARFIMRIKRAKGFRDWFLIEIISTGELIAVLRNEIKKQNKVIISKFRRCSLFCKRGHYFAKSNTRIRIKPNGQQIRICRTCNRINALRFYHNHKLFGK